MFAIGDNEWPGVSKLVEEIGELGQVLGKLMGSRGDTKHWSGDLRAMLHDEIGDVIAACYFVIERCGLDEKAILDRVALRLARFKQWHVDDPDPRGIRAAMGTCDGCERYSANLLLVDHRLLCGGCRK